MAKDNRQSDAERAAEAKRILARVEQDSETAGFSSAARVADKVRSAIAPDNADDANDPIEVLGTKIGRTLGLVAFVGLAIYLVYTYVL